MAQDFFAGCVGGAAGVLVGHPFDTIKVRLQTSSASVYRGTFHCFSSIVRQESVLGLYKGMSSPLYSLAFINAVVFGIQGNVQRRLPNPDSIYSHMIAGASAGVAQTIICSPMELAKTRMQIQGQGEHVYFRKHSYYKGPLDCLLRIYNLYGIRGVYRGFLITVAREAPSFALYFGSYEYLCQTLTSESHPSLSVLLLAGGLAGVCSWVFTYPMDYIKSRIQADGAQGYYRYTGYRDCFRKCIEEDGYAVLFRGFNATMLRAFPVNAATFTTVTLILRYFSENEEEKSDLLHLTPILACQAEHIMLDESSSAR